MRARMFQHLKAPSDPNGNPRRCFLLFDKTGQLIKVIDEGYTGLPIECRNLTQLPDMKISVSEYKEWMRNGQVG